MRVISTELLVRTAMEAMFEANGNPSTDVKHVVDFLKLMSQEYGFDIEKPGEEQ